MDNDKVFTEEELMEWVDYLCGLTPGERPREITITVPGKLCTTTEELNAEIAEALGLPRTATLDSKLVGGE
jgi:hypothetical protein